MLKAAVVEDHVHHHLQAFGMSLIAETLIVIVGTEARVHTVVIGSGITVISRKTVLLIGRVIFQDRCQPEGRHTEFVKVVEMLTDAIEVTAMTEGGFGAVFLVGSHTCHLRVVVGALCKTVWHQHIEHVGIGKAHALVATHLTLFQLERHFLTFSTFHLSPFKRQRHGARLGIAHVHIYK